MQDLALSASRQSAMDSTSPQSPRPASRAETTSWAVNDLVAGTAASGPTATSITSSASRPRSVEAPLALMTAIARAPAVASLSTASATSVLWPEALSATTVVPSHPWSQVAAWTAHGRRSTGARPAASIIA